VTDFISYSRDFDRVSRLVDELRRHGMRVWRDQDALPSGGRTEDEIDTALRNCDAFLLWLGEETFASDYVWRRELPRAIVAQRERGLRIVPLFVDGSASTAIDQVRNITGYEIGDNNGHVRGSDDIGDYLTRVARAETSTWLARRADSGHRPVVRMVTRSDGAPARDSADLNFDWVSEYPADGTLPDAATTTALQQALHASIQALLRSFAVGVVDVQVRCHLHLGVAIGFELRRVTGAVPHVLLDDDRWACRVGDHNDTPLSASNTPGAASAVTTALEISLTREVERDVSAYVAATDTRYRQRTRLAPRPGPSQSSVTAININAWADQAADEIRRARSEPDISAIDVFIAAPIGFAVALGWRLNAIGGIRLFHLEGNAGPYRDVWTLPAS